MAEVAQLPTLVLLPGLDGTGTLFAPFLAALDPGIPTQVIRYPTEGPQDPGTLAAFVAARLPTGPFVLLGESFSGPIALTLAPTRPPGLQGLILCATFARNPRPALAWCRRWLRWLPRSPHLLPLLRPWVTGRHRDAQLESRLREALTALGPDALRARLAVVLAVDATAACAAISVPTLDLRATGDRLVPESAAQLIAECLPHRIRRDIEAPHLLLQTQPAASAAAVQVFLADLSS